MSPPLVLEARGLGVSIGALPVVRGLDLDLAAGEVVALLGPNGSGKSTCLRGIAGLLPRAGACRVAGRLTYLPQEAQGHAALSALEVVLLGRLGRLGFSLSAEDLAAAAGALEEVGAAALLERPIGALSGGQRQLVYLAQALASGPELLLLDEPTSALDPRHQFAALGLLRAVARRRGVAMLVVLHDLNAAARFADRLVLLREGRVLAQGAPAAVLCPALIGQAYGLRVEVLTASDGHPAILPLGALENGEVP